MELKLIFVRLCILIARNTMADVFPLRNEANNAVPQYRLLNSSDKYHTDHHHHPHGHATTSDHDQLTIQDNERLLTTEKQEDEQPNQLFTEQFENYEGRKSDNVIKRILNKNDKTDDQITIQDNEKRLAARHGDEQPNQLFSEQFDNEEGSKTDNMIKQILSKNDKIKSDYEVTENIIDIPNNETLIGPVVTNFTLFKPLNLATITGNNTNGNSTVFENNDAHKYNNFNGDHDKNNILNVTMNTTGIDIHNEGKKALRKNYISIFHVKAEFDSKPNVHDLMKPFININQTVNIRKPYFQPFKDYLHGIKKGIANGIHSVLSKDKDAEVDHGVTRFFINKLHRASTAAVEKVHKAIFGPQFHVDDFDD